MTAPEDHSALQRRLAQALHAKSERDFAEFMSQPTTNELSASELDQRVSLSPK